MHSSTLLLLGLAAIFCGLAMTLTALVLKQDDAKPLRSLALIDALTSAPQQRLEPIKPSFTDRVLTPLLSRFIGVGRRLTPSGYTQQVQQKLDLAGNPSGMTADRIISLQALGFSAGLILALGSTIALRIPTVGAVALGVVVSLAGYFGPLLWLYQVAYDRREQMQRELPDSLDLLTISVEAGLGFNAAIAQVARNTDGPLAGELARVLQEMQIGLSRAQALRALGERSALPELKEFVTAMVQADELGVPIGKVLRVQSVEMRLKRRQRAEELAQKIPVKILMPLILCILPTLLIVVLGPGVISILAAFQNTP